MSDGYRVYKDHGVWFVRWSEYRNGKRSQPSHKLCSVREFPKLSDVRPLAEEYMARVRKAPTIEAGGTVNEFVSKIYFPRISGTLAQGTVMLYEQGWKRLKSSLGPRRLRDVKVMDVQSALDAIHQERGDELGHGQYMQAKVTASAIFSMALRLGHHPGPNPEDGTSVRGYGHTNQRENGAYTLQEIKQFLALFPSGQIAVTIGLNAFLALRKPELQALLPDDFNGDTVRIHRDTKTGNDERLPVIAPLKRLLADGWEPVNLQKARRAIQKRIKGTNLPWKGWYAFRRGMATNLFELGVPPEVAALSCETPPRLSAPITSSWNSRAKRLMRWPAWNRLTMPVQQLCSKTFNKPA